MGKFVDLFLVIMVLVFLLNYITKGELNKQLELDSNKIRYTHQYYRVVTYAFCHGSWFHLIANFLIIRNVIGPFFQDKLSSGTFVYVFLISSIFTGIMLLIHYSDTPFTFVGSSVGFYSFFGLMVVYYICKGWRVFLSSLSQQPFYNNLLLWAILIFFLGNFITLHVEKYKTFSGIYAHTISFLAGLIMGIFIIIWN